MQKKKKSQTQSETLLMDNPYSQNKFTHFR